MSATEAAEGSPQAAGHSHHPHPKSSAQLPHLVNDVDAIIQLLPLQEGVEVLQEVEQVPLAVAVRDKDGHVLQGRALRRVVPALGYLRVLLLHFLQCNRWFEGELAGTSCKRSTRTFPESFQVVAGPVT